MDYLTFLTNVSGVKLPSLVRFQNFDDKFRRLVRQPELVANLKIIDHTWRGHVATEGDWGHCEQSSEDVKGLNIFPGVVCVRRFGPEVFAEFWSLQVWLFDEVSNTSFVLTFTYETSQIRSKKAVWYEEMCSWLIWRSAQISISSHSIKNGPEVGLFQIQSNSSLSIWLVKAL